MRQKLILCDLDGTLLKSDKTISRRTAMTLEKCRERGILVGFATSRGKSNIAKYENQIRPDIVICNGGACVFCEGKLIRAATFSLDETRALLKKAYEICSDSAEITLDTLDRIFWNRTRDKSTEYAWDSIFDDFKDFKEPAMKICVQTNDIKKARAIASAVPGCDFLPFSDIPWHKFSAANATKESAIDFLCSHLGISADEITAFGDDHNDIGMLRMCGIGVAMQNAIAEVKEAADALTLSNDEDGVADFVERLMEKDC